MTEAGWTRERPTKNGWYWWRFDASISATIVRIMVCGDGSLAEMSNNGHLLLAANFDGEWLGPLSPTDRQQGRVAGLREAVPLACKYCNDRTKWTPMSNSGYHVCNMPEPDFVRCQAIKIHAALAQQAQEGGVGDAQ